MRLMVFNEFSPQPHAICAAAVDRSKQQSHSERKHCVNACDTVPSAYLLHVLNNRNSGGMSSPINTSALLFSGGKLALQRQEC